MTRPTQAEKPMPAVTIAELHTFSRSPKYEIRARVQERDGARWLSFRGFMQSANAGWIPAQQQVNFGAAEIDALISALERARESFK